MCNVCSVFGRLRESGGGGGAVHENILINVALSGCSFVSPKRFCRGRPCLPTILLVKLLQKPKRQTDMESLKSLDERLSKA